MQPSENLPLSSFLSLFGGSKAEARPDPIPNSAVKLSVADGSACIACARVGCRLFFFAFYSLVIHHGGEYRGVFGAKKEAEI